MRLPRPPRLPAKAAALVPAGERVIAWARDAADGYVIATGRALVIPEGMPVPWSRITKAVWDGDALDVTTVDEGGRPGPRLRLELPVPGDLPAAVHDRVTDSVVVSQRVDLGGGAGALLVARRPLSADADVDWTVVFDAGLDPGDPRLRTAADAALADLRETLGI